jgi:ferredoxin-type protein NapG
MNNLTRRQFLRLGVFDHIDLVRESTGNDKKAGDDIPKRPPGALSNDANFLEKCNRCGDCAEECPHNVISLLGPASGTWEGTPAIDTNTVPCRWCASMYCINACKTGALSFNDDGRLNPIGKAKLDFSLCLNSQGIICDECAAVCPSDVRAIRMNGRVPELDQDLCVGCGLCAHHCPATPTAIRIVPPGNKRG